MRQLYKYLFVFAAVSMITVSGMTETQAEISLESRYWNGLNPFFQPVHTLNYYGSGDVDNNGRIDRNDLDSLKRLISLKATTNYRADIDGDGEFSGNDTLLLKAHIESGKTLPSHWNELTKEQRITWLKRCLALDITSSIPPVEGSFVCLHYAAQFYCNFSYLGMNLAHTKLMAAGTIFNIPVYYMDIFGHAVNAVCVGDNPLEFSHWYFIEPQNDGEFDVDTGEGFELSMISSVIQNGVYSNKILSARRTDQGWSITNTASGFLTQRPALPVKANYVDVKSSWNPRIVRTNGPNPTVFFEKFNDRLPPTGSIYKAALVGGIITEETPIISDTMSARLLDVKQSPSGKLHILWRGTQEYCPTLFTGTISPGEKTVKNIATYRSSAVFQAGVICAFSDDSFHVFWIMDVSNIDTNLVKGINQSFIVRNNWLSPQNVDSFSCLLQPLPRAQRSFTQYYMSILPFKGNAAILSVPQTIQMDTSSIHLKLPLGRALKDYCIEPDSLVSGARAAIDKKNRIHCIYWATDTGKCRLPEGKVVYRSFDTAAWSAPFILDSSDINLCTDIAVNDRNDILTVWEKITPESTAVFSTRIFTNGAWQPIETHVPQDNESVCYPRITALSDTNYVVAWESQGLYRTTLRFKYLSYSSVRTAISGKNGGSVRPVRFRTHVRGNRLFIMSEKDAATPGEIMLFDLQGRMLLKRSSGDVRNCIINLDALGRGFTFVAIVSGATRFIGKLAY